MDVVSYAAFVLLYPTIQHTPPACKKASRLFLESSRNRQEEMGWYTTVPLSYADPAGDRARQYLKSFARVKLIPPADHDLSDYFRSGGNLRNWLASIITSTT
jgi:hypothetical protein